MNAMFEDQLHHLIVYIFNGDRLQRPTVKRFTDVLQVGSKGPYINGFGVDKTGIFEGIHDQIIVVFGIAKKNVGDLHHGLFVEIAGDSEVDQTHPAVIHNDRVAGMRVGMEQTEFHQLPGE